MELEMRLRKEMDLDRVKDAPKVELAPASGELFHRWFHSAHPRPDLREAFDTIHCVELTAFFQDCLLVPDPGKREAGRGVIRLRRGYGG